MPFTKRDAMEIVGDSTDWSTGLAASIAKWEQIAGGDEESYPRSANCGMCFVKDNRQLDCRDCPAYNACGPYVDPEVVLCQLREIDLAPYEEE